MKIYEMSVLLLVNVLLTLTQCFNDVRIIIGECVVVDIDQMSDARSQVLSL